MGRSPPWEIDFCSGVFAILHYRPRVPLRKYFFLLFASQQKNNTEGKEVYWIWLPGFRWCDGPGNWFFLCQFQIIINMVEANLDGNLYWYPLKTHDENGEPLAPPTPNQSPQSSFRAKGQRGPGEIGMKNLPLLYTLLSRQPCLRALNAMSLHDKRFHFPKDNISIILRCNMAVVKASFRRRRSSVG